MLPARRRHLRPAPRDHCAPARGHKLLAPLRRAPREVWRFSPLGAYDSRRPVGLAKRRAQDNGLAVLIERHNRELCSKLHSQLHTMTPAEFEALEDLSMTIPQPIHPFPARMAPHLALEEVQRLETGSVVLDPMMGSGTVVRFAAQYGHHASGRDVDPLAVLMTKVWTTPTNPRRLREAAQELVDAAWQLPADTLVLPWIDDDPETRAFVGYWFAYPQQDALRRLSYLLATLDTAESDALRLALSKIIITKDQGASLARDVSHSRPHRAFTRNSYLVYDGFLQAAHRLARRLEREPPPGNTDPALGDARALDLADSSVDAVITSPPYLNAIDYLRGHRLALVWLGHQLGALRTIRAESIGAERAPRPEADTELAAWVMRCMKLDGLLPQREHRMVERYILDLSAMLSEIHRVLRPGGRAVFVIGNSSIRGVFVKNSLAISTLAKRLGLRQLGCWERVLPPSRRYLPPPTANINTDLDRRMRTEIILKYVRE